MHFIYLQEVHIKTVIFNYILRFWEDTDLISCSFSALSKLLLNSASIFHPYFKMPAWFFEAEVKHLTMKTLFVYLSFKRRNKKKILHWYKSFFVCVFLPGMHRILLHVVWSQTMTCKWSQKKQNKQTMDWYWGDLEILRMFYLICLKTC